MRTLNEIKSILNGERKFLHDKYYVSKVGIFGSYTLGQQNTLSDVDILVEFREPIGWEFIDLKEHLENLLGLKVDLVSIKALKPQLKETILKQTVYV
jgi:hypothetical protein